MSNLANPYSALGRHQDALVMGEKTLEFQRRVLPENHPDIGATLCCGLLVEAEVDALCSRQDNVQSRFQVL
jgi:hypothetical protein